MKRTIVMLSGLLLSTTLNIQLIGAQTGVDKKAGEARSKVQKLGVGRDPRVEVKLRDGTRLKGHIGTAGDDSFTLVNSKTGVSQTLSYTDIENVKKPGRGLSTRTWIIIGAAAVATTVIATVIALDSITFFP